MNAVERTARFIRALQQMYLHKWRFLAMSFVVFFLTFSALLWFDLVPDPATTVADASATSSVSLSATPLVTDADPTPAPAGGELPVKVEIPAISLTASVSDPTTTNIEQLDQYLLKGAVRYPGSGLLGENGNVILFGHSSYLPIVNNLAYKTFDGIQKLKAGDTITVYSSDRAYEYSVDTVTKEDATSAGIPLTTDGQKLTLSTCDSFGTKSDRFVVSATFVGSHPLGN